MQSPTKGLYIGIMSGTSLDAVDTSLVEIDHDLFNPIANLNTPLPIHLKDEIYELNTPCPNELHRSQQLSNQLGFLFADCCQALLDKVSVPNNQISAIGLHGQTIRHQPDANTPYTLQIGNPNLLTEQLSIPVVADFRSRDIAAKGQGAPLVPLFHKALFGKENEHLSIVNIGGIANITVINSNQIESGFDTGPGNMLMNMWIKRHKGLTYDDKGQWASQGAINNTLLADMLKDPYFNLKAPKSTGRDYFNEHWLSQFSLSKQPLEDIMATLTELTAKSISQAIHPDSDMTYILGGGALNQYLLKRIQNHTKSKVVTSDKKGVDPNFAEAQAFAWLAFRRINHLFGNEPSATGAIGQRVLGAIYSA